MYTYIYIYINIYIYIYTYTHTSICTLCATVEPNIYYMQLRCLHRLLHTLMWVKITVRIC